MKLLIILSSLLWATSIEFPVQIMTPIQTGQGEALTPVMHSLPALPIFRRTEGPTKLLDVKSKTLRRPIVKKRMARQIYKDEKGAVYEGIVVVTLAGEEKKVAQRVVFTGPLGAEGELKGFEEDTKKELALYFSEHFTGESTPEEFSRAYFSLREGSEALSNAKQICAFLKKNLAAAESTTQIPKSDWVSVVRGKCG